MRIDPATGLLAASGQPDAIFETFRKDEVPQQSSDPVVSGIPGSNRIIDEQLF